MFREQRREVARLLSTQLLRRLKLEQRSLELPELQPRRAGTEGACTEVSRAPSPRPSPEGRGRASPPLGLVLPVLLENLENKIVFTDRVIRGDVAERSPRAS